MWIQNAGGFTGGFAFDAAGLIPQGFAPGFSCLRRSPAHHYHSLSQALNLGITLLLIAVDLLAYLWPEAIGRS